MNLTRLSLGNPVAVAVGAILVVIFGTIGMTRLPIEMTPEITRPEIQVSTRWRAAAPTEVESELIEPQENVLRSTPGLLRMSSSANYGSGSVTLEFVIGTDMNRALIEVMNRLNQVPRYPVDADEPIIQLGGSNFDRVIAWFQITTQDGNEVHGPMEQSFIGAPIEDPSDPVEMGHVARSYDSCLVCTVHTYDGKTGKELAQFRIGEGA